MAYVEGEMPVSVGGYNNGWGNGFMGDGLWSIIALAIIFGWGGNGFGFGGNGNGVYNATNDIESSIHSALDTLQITNKLDNLTTSLNSDFGSVINSITTNGYDTRLALNDLGYQLQQCCCEGRATMNSVGNALSSQLADLKYTLATEECATRQASADNTQRIIDFLTTDKLATLTAENSALKGELSQAQQTSNIVNALRTPTPIPAYMVQNPYTPYGVCNGTSIQ